MPALIPVTTRGGRRPRSSPRSPADAAPAAAEDAGADASPVPRTSSTSPQRIARSSSSTSACVVDLGTPASSSVASRFDAGAVAAAVLPASARTAARSSASSRSLASSSDASDSDESRSEPMSGRRGAIVLIPAVCPGLNLYWTVEGHI